MKWFAIWGAMACVAQPGLAWGQASSSASGKLGPAPAARIAQLDCEAVNAGPEAFEMSYPSASLGMALPARLLNAIRIGGDAGAVAESEEIVTTEPRTRRIIHIIGKDLE